ncbi:MAG: glycerophosphodiester phosphodiesterase [Chloroflexi bacterium]|nr:MAG: glycerophosphodiester phosphodiesterase [Chloroflexota bacterium]
MFDEISKPVVFAHRGASAYAPENTIAAFELALRQEADAVELDVKLTADGQVVVFHDQTLDRITGTSGFLAKKTLEQLREFDAGSFFDVEFKGETIPTLKEVFEAIGRKLFINIEITNYASPTDALPVRVAELVKKYGLQKWVMFSSFNPFALIRAHKMLPTVPVGLLALSGGSGWFARSRLASIVYHTDLHPEVRDVTPALIKREHGYNRRVNVYTVNDPEQMRRLFRWKIDGIITDDPLLARKVLANIKTSER